MRRTRLPVTRLEDGLLLSDSSAWAWFTVPTVSYDFLSEGDSDALLAATTVALAGLAGSECHLVVAPRPYDVHGWARQLDEATSQPAAGWSDYLSSLAWHVAEGGFWRRQVLLGILLGRRRSHTALGLLRGLERAAGLNDPSVSRRELDAWRAKGDAVERTLTASSLQARRASVDELRWLVQRAFWRGLGEPPGPAGRPQRWGRGEVEALAESTLHNGHRSLVLEQPGGTASLAFLAAARFPDAMAHPGSEWLYLCDALGFPVEVSLRFRLVAPWQASADAEKKLAEAADQARHISGTSADLPLHLLEVSERARQLEYAVTKEGLPLVYGWPRFVVAARSATELEARVDFVVEAYRELGIDLVRPAGDQLSLFFESLPGGRLRVRSYEQRQALVTFAGGMFQASTNVGDGRGPYIGETTGQSRAPVHFDPLAAAQRNLPTAIAITGQPGGGKTHLAELLLYQLALRGVWSLMVDPKNEATGLAGMASLDNVRLLEVGPHHEGLLDPFSVAEDPSEGLLLAADVLRLLLPPGLSAEEESLLLSCCHDEADADQRSLGNITRRIAASRSPAGRRLANTLRAVAAMPLAQLFFAPPASDPLVPDEHLTIVQIRGLTVPDAGASPAELAVADRLAIAVMYLLTAFAARLAGTAPAQAKAIVLDEAWALTGSRQGRALIQRLARTGRSKNTALVLVSQNASDFLGPEVQNNFSAKFAFRSTQEDEVLSVLRLLGVEASAEHVRAVRTLGNGECLFADLDGRVASVQIDLVFRDLAEALDTTPHPDGRPARAVQPDPIGNGSVGHEAVGSPGGDAGILGDEAEPASLTGPNGQPAAPHVNGVNESNGSATSNGALAEQGPSEAAAAILPNAVSIATSNSHGHATPGGES